jgi:outer membrane protein assembly factor BamB
LIFTNDGLAGHDLATGKELWQYAWAADGSSSAVCQPLLLGDGKIVLGGGRIGIGSRCIQVAKGEDGWTTNEVWKSKFSPGFNDFIQHAGFLYGLESGRLVCLEAATGKQRWRDGKFGAGEVLLAGDKLVIQSEDGPVYLVNPSPDGYQEVAELPALKDKTWNHPVVANGRLLVRNGQEAVCFNLGTPPGQ